MDKLLSPEKNVFLLHKYHTSSKLLLPLICASYFTSDFDNTNKIINILNICNIGFHSYVSSSCIITDYIKPIRFSNFTRASSLFLHGFATYGFYKSIIFNVNKK